MIEAIKYRWHLRRLHKKYDETSKLYNNLIAQAENREEKEEIRQEEGPEIQQILEEIESLKTKRFCRLASRLLVPIPDDTDKEMWSEKFYSYGHTLTRKGIWEIKKLMRQEERERRERFVVWFPALAGILAAIAGIIAAITGLAAVLRK